MIIDAHQHFWNLERGDYDWLTEDLAPIFQNFLPDDLEPILKKVGGDGTILVQATDTDAETDYLLSLADKNSWILGVVGWVNMEADDAPRRIKELASHKKFVGIRPMIQGIEDDEWMLKPDLAPAFEMLIEEGLTFDALVLPRHLKPLKTLVKRHSDLKVIIDHGAKPSIRDKSWQPWADDMSEIAETSNTYCKLSGLATEANADWQPQDIEPYAKHILSAFGPERTVFGSDWPVLKLAGDYEDWFEMAKQWIPQNDRGLCLGKNAARFYLRK